MACLLYKMIFWVFVSVIYSLLSDSIPNADIKGIVAELQLRRPRQLQLLHASLLRTLLE